MTWVDRMTKSQADEFVEILDGLLSGVDRLREMNRELRQAPPGDPDSGNELWAAAGLVMDGAAVLLPLLDDVNARRGS